MTNAERYARLLWMRRYQQEAQADVYDIPAENLPITDSWTVHLGDGVTVELIDPYYSSPTNIHVGGPSQDSAA